MTNQTTSSVESPEGVVQDRAAAAVDELFGGVTQNPFPLYDELRELGDGIHLVPAMDGVLVTRYDDVRRIVADHRTFSSDYFETAPPGIHDPSDPEHRRFVATASRLFMFADPPRHTEIRATFRHAFTPEAASRWAGIIEEVTDDSLGRFLSGQDVDLMPHLAADVPVAVIAKILGVPSDQWQNFRDWSFGYASTFDPMVQGDRRDAAIKASLTLFDYLNELAEQRARVPGEDLISHMIGVSAADGRQLRGEDLVAQIALLLVAGNETTTNLVGNGITLLLDHPEAKRDLVADPTLLGTAVEEMLRLDPPLHLTMRRTTKQVTLGSREIEPGTMMLLCIAAANRDPRAFKESATFDIRRSDNKHLAFLHGIHFCVGAALARLEARIIFERLLARFPDIGPGSAAPVRRTLNVVSRGWQSRPVKL